MGSFCAQLAVGPDSAVPRPAERAEQHQDEENSGNPTRQTDPLKHLHCRLQHKAEHEGEDDRQNNLGGYITSGEHREHKKAA